MKRTLRAVVPAVAALLVAVAASAQTVPSSYRYIKYSRSVSLYGGYLHTNPQLALPDSQSAEFGPQPAPMFGVRGAMRVGGPLSIEGHLGFAPTERKIYGATVNTDSTRVTPVDTGERASQLLALGEFGVRFHLTGDRTYHGFAPFVLASGGAALLIGGTTESDTIAHRKFDFGPALAVGAGTGVDYFASDRVSLRAELTYRLWRLSAPDGLVPALTRDKSAWSGNAGVSVGAAYHF
jgi:opacity protein-like surface antigen